jgi:DNA-binding transcriptional MerR regulator
LVTPRKPRQGLTIGAVLANLQQEFPDVTISKIRFLESEGLVTPARTGSGYRTYADRDIERLHYILRAQRDHYWPLKVIRDALDAMERGLTPDPDQTAFSAPRVPAPSLDPDLPSASDLARSTGLRLTRREVVEETGLPESTVEALENFGLLRADASGHFGEPALAIARAAAGLAGYGIEPRHLRPFRTAADREIGLVQQVVTPLRASGKRGGREAGVDPTPDILRLCIALHTAVVRDGLARG